MMRLVGHGVEPVRLTALDPGVVTRPDERIRRCPACDQITPWTLDRSPDGTLVNYYQCHDCHIAWTMPNTADQQDVLNELARRKALRSDIDASVAKSLRAIEEAREAMHRADDRKKS